ncbi:hypothetical protein IE53DRAFT_387813 [Violaceomyces palustris]|uniref:Uncharacterized protein n=1 Tax=Violaceomyces palustris TaxID=1673888 RepID=A0ACD0NVX4_9BASI|nr:hypothetical protein IE53DRAFT_387813 [Violaceomyces palustris]
MAAVAISVQISKVLSPLEYEVQQDRSLVAGSRSRHFPPPFPFLVLFSLSLYSLSPSNSFVASLFFFFFLLPSDRFEHILLTRENLLTLVNPLFLIYETEKKTDLPDPLSGRGLEWNWHATR